VAAWLALIPAAVAVVALWQGFLRWRATGFGELRENLFGLGGLLDDLVACGGLTSERFTNDDEKERVRRFDDLRPRLRDRRLRERCTAIDEGYHKMWAWAPSGVRLSNLSDPRPDTERQRRLADQRDVADELMAHRDAAVARMNRLERFIVGGR
jgi:hypothetical protein